MYSMITPKALVGGNAVARRTGIYKTLFAALLTLMATSTASAISADGWASENGGTTGGTGGTVVTVDDATDFLTYATTDTTKYIIQISGTINLGNDEHVVKSNKTIVGLGTTGKLIGTLKFNPSTQNVIVKNLTITTYDQVSDRDGISIRGGKNIWVNHCTFVDCKDGSVDQGVGADFVTISWCKFYYSESGSNKPNLVGGSNLHDETDEGHLRATFHHNWYGSFATGRMPMVRFGKVHVYNTYFNSPGCNMYFGVAWMCEILAEKNYFEDGNQTTAKVWYYYETNGKLKQTGNYFKPPLQWDSGGGDDVVFDPPYSYELDDVNDVKSLVMASAGVNGDTGGGSDTTDPTVAITAPADEAIVSGTISVTANASDNVGVVGVQFKLDGANLGSEDTSAPYSINWNSTTASPGTHILTAVARDAAGNTTTSIAVDVTTTGVVTSLTLINADTDQPIAGYDPFLSGTELDLSELPTDNLNVRANVSGSVGSVRFALDANSNYRTENAAPYALAGDNSGDYNAWTPSVGSHTMSATAWSGSGASGSNLGSLPISFTVVP